MMTSVDQLLNDFIEAWNAGQRPQVADYLARAPDAERDELAALVRTFLEDAPTPPYSAETLAELRADPLVVQLGELVDSRAGVWPSMLPRLRNALRLTRDQVVSSLAQALGVEGREEKVKAYYHQMESGTIEPAGVSRRVFAALAGIFKVDPSEIEAGGDLTAFGPTPATEMHMRLAEPAAPGEGWHAERLEDVAAHSPVPEERWDEVDRLFRGGR